MSSENGDRKFLVKPTEASQVPKMPKRDSEAQLREQGLRRLTFVVPIELWDRHLAKCVPVGTKPNTLFEDWLRREVGA